MTAHADLRVKALFGVYGKERDAWIAQSKIVLNVHYYNVKIFEAVRISYLLNNRVIVLSEESGINPYQGVAIPMTSYENIEAEIRRYLSDDGLRDRTRIENYEQFKAGYSMRDLLGKVISRWEVSPSPRIQ